MCHWRITFKYCYDKIHGNIFYGEKNIVSYYSYNFLRQYCDTSDIHVDAFLNWFFSFSSRKSLQK